MDVEMEELFRDVDDSPTRRRAPEPYLTILLHFAEPEDRAAFERLIGRAIPLDEIMWYPRDPEATW